MAINYYPTYVPDDGPEGAKILIVGEAPGEDEVNERKPFVGNAGRILVETLNRAGLSRSDVRLANLCHYRPYMNKFENILHEQVLKDGVKELGQYIREHRPNVIVPLGNWPLHFMTGLASFNNKKQISGISRWRGSIVTYIADESIKVIPTFHPAYITRNASAYPIFDIDFRRIASDAMFPERRLRERRFIINPTGMELEEWVQKLCASEYVATDIETVKETSRILCVGFAPSPEIAVCFVPTSPGARVAIQRVLSSPAKKIFQFGSFDTEQLRINEFIISDPSAEEIEQPYWWDTLLAQHILAPELPRSLEFLTSIYTREPYYKRKGRATIPEDTKGWSEKFNAHDLYEYNCMDCCVTAEVFEAQVSEIAVHPSRHLFYFEMRALDAAGHISRSGVLIDTNRRDMLMQALSAKWYKKQIGLDGLVGREVNVNSHPTVKKILYDKEFLGLPVRRNRNAGITADEDAIVSLIAYCKERLDSVVREETKQSWKEKLAICKAILEIRGIRKMLSTYLKVRISCDGRLRSTYKVGGTETGRWSAVKFVDGTGLNSQTFPRDPIEVPDEVYEAASKLLVQLNEDDDEGNEEESDEDH